MSTVACTYRSTLHPSMWRTNRYSQITEIFFYLSRCGIMCMHTVALVPLALMLLWWWVTGQRLHGRQMMNSQQCLVVFKRATVSNGLLKRYWHAASHPVMGITEVVFIWLLFSTTMWVDWGSSLASALIDAVKACPYNKCYKWLTWLYSWATGRAAGL